MSEEFVPPKRAIVAATTPVDMGPVTAHLKQRIQEAGQKMEIRDQDRIPEFTDEAKARFDKARANANGRVGTSYSKTPQELGMVQRISPEATAAHFNQSRKAKKREAKALAKLMKNVRPLE